MPNPANHVVLEGTLVETVVVRVSPKGRVVASLELEHHTDDPVSGRQIACRLTIIATDQLAEFCRTLLPGTGLRVTGGLDQRRWIRDGQTRWGKVELGADTIQVLASPTEEPVTQS